MSKRVTMIDIARECGVSQTLVSFVLGGVTDKGISQQTRESVIKTAERMGYFPSAAARMLKYGRSGYIAAVFIGRNKAEKTAEAIGRINALCMPLGYSLAVYGDPVIGVSDFDYISLFESGKADGIVFVSENGSELEAHIHLADEKKIPYTADIDCVGELIMQILAPEKNKKVTKRAVRKKRMPTKKDTEETQTVSIPTAKKQEAVWLL